MKALAFQWHLSLHVVTSHLYELNPRHNVNQPHPSPRDPEDCKRTGLSFISHRRPCHLSHTGCNAQEGLPPPTSAAAQSNTPPP